MLLFWKGFGLIPSSRKAFRLPNFSRESIASILFGCGALPTWLTEISYERRALSVVALAICLRDYLDRSIYVYYVRVNNPIPRITGQEHSELFHWR